MIGCIGTGKSTILNALFSQNFNIHRQEFKANKSPESITKEIKTRFCQELNSFIIDTPGQTDPNIPMPFWLESYNMVVKGTNPTIDLVLVVFENKERVSTGDVSIYTFINEAFKMLKPDNLALVYNKSDLDEVKKSDVLEDYNLSRSKISDCLLPDLTCD